MKWVLATHLCAIMLLVYSRVTANNMNTTGDLVFIALIAFNIAFAIRATIRMARDIFKGE